MFGLTVDRFEGFDAKDYDAFEQRKWSSTRFNLERMKVADKLKILGVRLLDIFREQGLDLQREITPHHPAKDPE